MDGLNVVAIASALVADTDSAFRVRVFALVSAPLPEADDVNLLPKVAEKRFEVTEDECC